MMSRVRALDPTSVRRSIAPSLRGYRRSWLGRDLLAAVTLLVIAVPEQLATARLAGMPPVAGLYAFVAAATLFALLGTDPHLSVGADSTIAPLVAAGVGTYAAAGSVRYTHLAAVLALLVGGAVVLIGVLRMGWIADLLSAPIVTGFLGGVGVIVAVHQLPDVLGVPGSGGGTVHRLVDVLRHLDRASPATALVAMGVLAVVLVAERLDRRLPGAMVAVIASTAVVGLLDLRRHGVAVLGRVAHGAPHVGWSGVSWTDVRHVLPVAGVIALVVVTQTAATARAFAHPARRQRRDEQAPEPDEGRAGITRDFVAVGAGGIAAGLVGAFPVNASPPRTAVLLTAGGRTQLAGLITAALVLAAVPALGLLRDLPLATLGAVLLLIAARIVNGGDLLRIARFDRVELALALVTLLVVAVVGVEQGIGAAVALAILDRTRRTARPQVHVLGRLAGTTSWVPVSDRRHPQQVPGVVVALFAAPLWYANAEHFRRELEAAVDAAHPAAELVVLDTIGMSDLDYTGARALDRVLDRLDSDGVGFAVARAGEHVRTSLRRSGLLERIGADRLFPSVDAAVCAPRPPRTKMEQDRPTERETG